MDTTSAFSKNHLAIEIGSGFCFLLLGDKSKQNIEKINILALNAKPSAIESLLNTELANYQDVDSVSLSIANLNFSLVPDAIFERRHLQKYLALNTSISAEDELMSNPIYQIQAQICYSYSKQILQCISKLFPSVHIRHSMDYFIQRCVGEKHPNISMYLAIYPGFFFCVICKEKEFLFANAFPQRVAADILYYALNVAEQCQLRPEQVDLFIEGELASKHSLNELFSKYFIRVKIRQELTLSQNFKNIDIESFRFGQLTHQFKCEF